MSKLFKITQILGLPSQVILMYLKNCLNHLNFEIWVILLFWHNNQRGGQFWWTIWHSDVLFLLGEDVLTFWCPDVQFLTRWPYQGYGPPSTDGELLVSSLALMQMWVTDGPCVLKTSWGSLDQDNTSCLFWEIPDLENLRHGATGSFRSRDSVLYQFDTYFDCCDDKSFAYLTPQWLM